MSNNGLRRFRPPELARVSVNDAFWAPRIEANRLVTVPAVYAQCKATGRLDAWKLDWKPGMPNEPHIFWDSDVAKWLEAAAYCLATRPDAELQRQVDEAVDLIVRAQRPDGHLNTHFTVVEPDRRWTNLRDCHELYCAGHLTEAAVAHYEATGRREFLDAACRYADHIDSAFGPQEGKKRGYPGHEELELALVKLYRATGQERYLKLSQYFVDERGRQPHYFDVEARARGEDPRAYWAGGYDYCQAHLPVRQQATVEGHAVRAMYLFSAMADLAAETGDRTLWAACKRLWGNVTERRMYVTGGVGSSAQGERFTFDYDLPNETAYAETCAAIGLVFWAHRMLQIECNGRYADVMERALYNNVLAGVSLDGMRFFYVNPLSVRPEGLRFTPSITRASRQEWFGCACCPPNIARLLASFPRYVYSQGKDQACVHLFVGSTAELNIGGRRVVLTQETDYPWDGTVRLSVRADGPARFTLALRLPAWCRRPRLKLNGRPVPVKPIASRGYARIRRLWAEGDTVELDLPTQVERVEAHPEVRAAAGRVALQRGPLVYCLEEADNGPNLDDIALPRKAALHAGRDPRLLGGAAVITGRAVRRDTSSWKGQLYRPGASKSRAFPIRAVPYCMWANRKPGEMAVWIRDA
jgi:DUF1680 family protein